jgi:heme-degrading monooxygenase HmoA
VFVELHLYAPLDGRNEDTRRALHETARGLKAEHGLRQVSVLEEQDGHLGLMTIWESRDAWSRANPTRERIAAETDLSGVDPAATRVLLLSET